MGQGKKPTTDATGGTFSPGIFGPNFDRDTGGLGGAGAIDLGDDAVFGFAGIRTIRWLSCVAQELTPTPA